MNEEKRLCQEADNIIHKELTSILANERTYAAWIRTAMATFVTGLAVTKIFNDLLGNLALLVSLILFICSACFFFLAAWRYQHVGKRLITERVAGASATLLIILSMLLGTAIFLASIGILIEK